VLLSTLKFVLEAALGSPILLISIIRRPIQFEVRFGEVRFSIKAQVATSGAAESMAMIATGVAPIATTIICH
jgi:hypothetical protein